MPAVATTDRPLVIPPRTASRRVLRVLRDSVDRARWSPSVGDLQPGGGSCDRTASRLACPGRHLPALVRIGRGQPGPRRRMDVVLPDRSAPARRVPLTGSAAGR